MSVFEPGSFRDPRGRVFTEGDRVLRAVYEAGAPHYRAARDRGVFDALAEKSLLLPLRELDAPAIDGLPGAVHILEADRIPFLSWPYEWSFAAHREAALLHLDTHLAALEMGFTLSDASAYNVQFIGTRPVFIDHLSLEEYTDGDFWIGHRQFCMQFLNPLLLWSKLGMAPNALFRGNPEGISPEDTARILPWRTRFSPSILTHVHAQAALQRRQIGTRGDIDLKVNERRLPKSSLVGMLTGLRNFISRLDAPKGHTVWGDYANATSYSSDEAAEKTAFVERMAAATRPRMLFDVGCNTGDYSQAALRAGAQRVIGFDFDHAALDQAFHRFANGDDRGNFLPVFMDASNPTPSQGWGQSERKGLQERATADAMIALAIIHHIAIGMNVPLPMAVAWLTGLAPVGIIEFPSKADPMVKRLLQNRRYIFDHYTEDDFLAALKSHARIVDTCRVGGDGRLLVWYDRGTAAA